MKQIKTRITYKVPDWDFCNCSSFGKPTKDVCRFCVKVGKKHVCVLHNMPLEVQEGFLIKKDAMCIKATAGFAVEVTDVAEEPDIKVDPKTVMKMALQEYRKVYKQLVSQGYPDAMADKLAQQYLLGGK